MLVRRLAALVAVALAAGGLTTASVATGDRSTLLPATATPPVRGAIIDDESLMEGPDCAFAQLTGPAAISPASVTGGPKITLDVMVLVDVAEGARIAAIKDPAARRQAAAALYRKVADRLRQSTRSYAPIDISLVMRRFGMLQPLVNGVPRKRVTDGQQIIELAKTFLGGRRPPGIDVVYVATDLDIQSPTTGSALAGLADCIGGIAHPEHAFAVGELFDEVGIDLAAVRLWPDFSAKVFGHEIGHLMGGHHHYQECGTAVAGAMGNREVGPCTLMTNLVDFQSFPFSTLNGMVVRGHAERWAR